MLLMDYRLRAARHPHGECPNASYIWCGDLASRTAEQSGAWPCPPQAATTPWTVAGGGGGHRIRGALGERDGWGHAVAPRVGLKSRDYYAPDYRIYSSISIYSISISKAHNFSTRNFGLIQHVSPKGGPETCLMRIEQQNCIVT